MEVKKVRNAARLRGIGSSSLSKLSGGGGGAAARQSAIAGATEMNDSRTGWGLSITSLSM